MFYYWRTKRLTIKMMRYLATEPNVSYLQKNVTLQSERYTADFFVYRMSKHCLIRNHFVAIRNELHFDKTHACCMIQFLLILTSYCTHTISVHWLAMIILERLRFYTYTGTCTCSPIEKPVCVSWKISIHTPMPKVLGILTCVACPSTPNNVLKCT